MLARCLILLVLAASLRDMLVFRHLIIIDLVWGKFHLRVLTLLEAVVALHCLARARRYSLRATRRLPERFLKVALTGVLALFLHELRRDKVGLGVGACRVHITLRLTLDLVIPACHFPLLLLVSKQ